MGDFELSAGDYETVSNQPTISLLPNDLATIYSCAEQRDSARSYGGELGVDREETHVIGLKGEFGLAKYYDLEVDTEFRVNGDDGTDFRILLDGVPVAVDVKTTIYWDEPWLKVMPEQTNTPAQVYVLAAVDGVTVKLVGMIEKEVLLDRELSYETGYTANYIAKPDELLELPEKSLVSVDEDADRF